MTTSSQASNQDGATLRDQVRSAVIWRSGTQILGQLITWASTFLVIRLLSPSDYGLYAMTAAVLGLLTLVNGYGLANALIQKREVTPYLLRQLFGMLIVLNVCLATIQFIAAPFVASYYGHPLLTDMLRVQSLIYLTNPFLALGYAVLSRQMDFRKQAQVNLVSGVLAALTALAGALGGLGVWTLVIAPLVGFGSRAFGTALAARVFIRPTFRFGGAWSLARYGGIVAVGEFFWFIQTQSDVVIAGRVFDPHMLGIYTTALFLTQMFVTKFVPPLNEVAFSAYARVQDDREAMARGFLKAVRIIMLVGIPFCLGLAASAEPAVKVVLGDKWLETAPVIQILGIAMPFMTLHVLFSPAVNAAGRPGIDTRNSLMGALMLPIAFYAGTHWGVTGLATAWVVGYPILMCIAAFWVLPIIGVTARELVGAVAPPVIAGIIMYAVVETLALNLPASLSPVIALGTLIATGGVIYGGVMLIFARGRILEVLDLLRRRGR